MDKRTKPLLVIVLGVLLAGGAAWYVSSQKGESGSSTAAAPGPDGAAGSASNTAPAPSAPKPGGGHLRGNPNAPITLVEYGDYQCPSCGHYHPLVQELLRRHPDKIKLQFHHYPLVTVHPNALPAALAVEAAGNQGKYFEMHDLVFESQNRWDRLPNPEPEFLALAAKVGLDANRFMQDFRSLEIRQRVMDDVTRGNALGVQGTPAFFVDGQPVEPLPSGPEDFLQSIDLRHPGVLKLAPKP